jgi:ATP-dependent Lhr-like helicase
LYPALRQMEERGWIRRGMFISGLGGSQFAMNAAVESLRAMHSPGRKSPVKKRAVVLAAVDPANPYGALLPWPKLPGSGESEQSSHGMARTSGASVLMVEGDLVAYFRRGNPALKLWLPELQPELDDYARAAAQELARVALLRQSSRSGVLISEINLEDARGHVFGRFLEEAGFTPGALGYQMRQAQASADDDSEDEEADFGDSQ